MAVLNSPMERSQGRGTETDLPQTARGVGPFGSRPSSLCMAFRQPQTKATACLQAPQTLSPNHPCKLLPDS